MNDVCVRLFGEEGEQGRIYLVNDLCEVIRTVLEIKVVNVYGQDASAVFLVDEILVEMVEVAEVVDGHGLLIVAPPFLNVGHEMRHGCTQVDHQVGIAQDVGHLLKEFHVGLEVPVGEIAHLMVVGGEDVHALVDAPVLDDILVGMSEFQQVLEALLEEVNLKVEGPSRYVFVVVFEVRVIVHGLKLCCPAIVLCEHIGEGGLTASNVSGDDDVHSLLVKWFSACKVSDFFEKTSKDAKIFLFPCAFVVNRSLSECL